MTPAPTVSSSQSQWTILTAKRRLPAVAVQIGDHVVNGNLVCQNHEFATVILETPYHNQFNPVWIEAHFTWSAVVESLNGGGVLTIV